MHNCYAKIPAELQLFSGYLCLKILCTISVFAIFKIHYTLAIETQLHFIVSFQNEVPLCRT